MHGQMLALQLLDEQIAKLRSDCASSIVVRPTRSWTDCGRVVGIRTFQSVGRVSHALGNVGVGGVSDDLPVISPTR